MTIPEIQHHLNTLAVEIGARPVASENNRRAAEYIRAVMSDCGYQVELQEYDCLGWQHDTTQVELNGQMLEAIANRYAPSCEVSGPCLPLGTLAELENAQAAGNLAGAVVILYGTLSQSPVSPKAWFLISEEEQTILRLLEDGRPAALLAVQTQNPGELVQLFEDPDLPIPSATVSARAGLALVRQPGATVRVKISGQTFPGCSWNVLGRLPAAHPAGAETRKLVLCAHYDTKEGTPGAQDNAAGVSALLGLARVLAGRALPFDLELAAFSSEEYLPVGSMEYARRAGEESFANVLAAINCDGIGAALGANSITVLSAPESFEVFVRDISSGYPGVVWVEPWPSGDHAIFAFRGVPSIALSSKGYVPNEHQSTDTIEWVSAEKVEEVVRLVAEIVDGLAAAGD